MSITVFIVDRDESVRRALGRLMGAQHFQAVCMDSLETLLAQDLPGAGAVILADVATVRDASGGLPIRLHGSAARLPVIYTTDYDTTAMLGEARRLGAAGYFRRPLDQQALVDAILFAVEELARDP